MFPCIRYLILAVIIVFLTVLQSQNISAAPETQNMVSSPLKNMTVGVQNSSIDEDSRANSKCAPPGGRCNGACDCCQHGTDAYECTLNEYSGRKRCTSAHLPPLWCPFSPKPCRPNDAPCTKDCDCCQTDQGRKPHRVTCYIEQGANKGYCLPQPYVVIDCFPLPPPQTPPPPKA